MTFKSAIIPTLTYRDAPAAIDFLCAAFGFERHLVVPDESDPAIVAHCQLVFDGAMVMISSDTGNAYQQSAPVVRVAAAGGVTQAPYIILEDVDGHAARARAAGADIFIEPVDNDYGGRGYGARDREGHVWNFGSYNPFT